MYPMMSLPVHESSRMQLMESSCTEDGVADAKKEEVTLLKRSCSGYIGRLARQYKEIEVLLANKRNHDLVVSKYDSLKNLFSSYETKFNEYYSMLPEYEAACSMEQFETHQTNYSEFQKRITEWTESIEEPSMKQAERTTADDDSVSDGSLKSRKSNTSSTSSVRLREARVKRQLAVLEREQLKATQGLKRQQLELEEKLATMQIEHTVASANAEIKVWEDECVEEGKANVHASQVNESPQNDTMHSIGQFNAIDTGKMRDTPDKITDHPVITNKFNPNAQEWMGGGWHPHEMPNSTNDPTNTHLLYQTLIMSNMPKPELSTFSGDPGEYWGFINNFEANIGSKAIDDRTRLTYLVQYCTGRARESIEDCVLLEPGLGYRKAREILSAQFGQPHIICHALLNKVISGKQVRPNDGEALRDLARVMRKCLITVSQMGYGANLDSTDTLFNIQGKLPLYLQSEWAKRAHGLIRSGSEPKFCDMTLFLEQAATTANSMYGQNIGKGVKVEKPGQKGKSVGQFQRAYSFVTNSGEKPYYRRDIKCPCCSGQHIIVQCKEFKDNNQRERLRLVRHHRLCDNCLRPFHIARDCRQESNCDMKGCDRKHHTLLHFAPKQYHRDSSVTGAGECKQPNSAEGVNQGINLSMVSSRRVCLRVLPVRVMGNGKEIVTWALLDTGSDISLCKRALVERLGLEGNERGFSLKTVTGTECIRSMEVSLSVGSMTCSGGIDMPRVWTVDELPISTDSIPTQKDISQWSHLKGIELPLVDEKEVMLLVGSDTPEAFWVEEQRRGGPKEPYAVRTPLGWTLVGPLSGSKKRGSAFRVHQVCGNDQLQDQLKRFWEIDHSCGKADSIMDSLEDQRARSIMEATVKLVDGHYEVGMPWRYSTPGLPNNWYLAKSRLKSLKGRFKRDAKLQAAYTATINEYIEKGYAREVPHEDNATEGSIWYLPHHPVIHHLKPDKVRVVFDCAAQYKGISLNSQLLQGPDFTNNLVGVLTRFRQEKIALMADVEAMFHQVNVVGTDVDALRFLWWQDGDPEMPLKEYQMTVHLFGATSSPSCAGFALRKTAKDNQGDFGQDVHDTVMTNFYVDDCLKSVGSIEEAHMLIQQLCEMLQRGGFRLTKWISNYRDVISVVPTSERAKSVVDLALDNLPIERTLGVLWDIETDSFKFKVSVKDVEPTRRGLLSAVSSLYDPLGFVSPFTLKAKILLQDLCAKGFGWDEYIGSEEQLCWNSWVAELPMLQNVSINRCLKPADSGNLVHDIHVFCDASERGYAAVSYMRTVNSSEEISCSFVMGKARLCPLKQVTVPRLELMAAVLAVELGQNVREELTLPVNTVTYWTDSTAVLQYIRNESRRFRTFVANRIAKIQEASDVKQWRHVDTHSNPADDGSRGLHAENLSGTSKWLNGPEFLLKTEDHWPVSPLEQDDVASSVTDNILSKDMEVKNSQVYLLDTMDLLEEFMTRYSNWQRLQRGVAWILKYKQYLLNKVREQNCKIDKVLSVVELAKAEREIVIWLQGKSFPKELAILKYNGSDMSKCWKRTTFNKLSPILVQGVLRVGGRLSNAPLDFDQIHPVILPSYHHITKLIIESYHAQVGHMGAGMTWTSLRTKYWIIRGGAAVRKFIGNCFNCKKRNAPRGQQFMADLPAARVTPEKAPFSFVGVDLFGPLYVKQGRSMVKRYGCLFTCLTMRAVHIELVDTLDTDSFINALRRFICRRGKPEKIFSDNGTNFRGSEKELKEALQALDADRVGNHLRRVGIEWEFNPPTASHMGGVWERVIRSIRRIMKVLLKGQSVTQEVLSTVLTEVEAILNSRPLTQISLDPKDCEPLTPNHILLMRDSPNLPPGVFTKHDGYGKRRWRQCQYLVSQFWKRWVLEYLPLLQERQKWFREMRNFQVNDLVLLADDGIPRGQWSLGRVVQVFPDRKGRTRQVEVRIGMKYFRRPISKLCLLEEDCMKKNA